MIVDIHVHPPDNKKDLRNMLNAARNAGIDKVCLLSELRFSYNNKEKNDVLTEYNDLVVEFHRGSCTDPDGVISLEKSVKEYGTCGMKIHEEQDWVLRGLLACHVLLRKAGELKIPVVIHSWHLEEGLPPGSEEYVGPSGGCLPAYLFGEISRRCPDTTFIFAHMGGVWEKAFQSARPYKNVCFDTSGFDPIMGVVERAVEILGPERIFFGSDAYGRNFVAQLAKVQYADISEEARQMILGENAARILNLRRK